MLEFTIHNPVMERVTKDGQVVSTVDGKIKVRFVIPKRPFLFWVDRKVAESHALPPGYGVAWEDWNIARFLVAPMPFNLLIAAGIWCWKMTRHGVPYFFYRTSKFLAKNNSS